MDTGQIIAQRTVPVFSDDTVESLSQRVKVEEHILYPIVIDQLSS
jgi:phosphoribosylglycinamide formyltransferase-1